MKSRLLLLRFLLLCCNHPALLQLCRACQLYRTHQLRMLSQARTRLLSLSSRGLSTSVTARQQPHEVADLEEPSRLAAAQMGTMLDIGARSIFTSEHDMFRDQVRRWMRERLAPLQNSFEEEGQPSKEIWREMGNQVRQKSCCLSKPSFVFVSRDC